jgi:hypothetical protein
MTPADVSLVKLVALRVKEVLFAAANLSSLRSTSKDTGNSCKVKAFGGGGGQFRSFLTFALDGSQYSISCSGRFIPRK